MTCVLRAIVLTTGGGQVETTAVGTVSAGREIDTHNVWNPARRCKNQKKSDATSNGTKDGPNNTQSTAQNHRRNHITLAPGHVILNAALRSEESDVPATLQGFWIPLCARNDIYVNTAKTILTDLLRLGLAEIHLQVHQFANAN